VNRPFVRIRLPHMLPTKETEIKPRSGGTGLIRKNQLGIVNTPADMGKVHTRGQVEGTDEKEAVLFPISLSGNLRGEGAFVSSQG